jgi:FixJ family two-component response regulator
MQSRRSASDFFQRKMREQKRSGTGDAERPGGIPTFCVGTRKPLTPENYGGQQAAHPTENLKQGEINMSIANVLLVDDEVPFVEAMTKRLTRRDLTIFSAFSGEEALERLKENATIEVVILDVKMPGMDGIETLRRIKAEYPLTEVIMLTGHATVETGIEGMKLGAFDYLMKPCDMDQLIAKVGEASSKKRRHEEKIIEARVKEITGRRA